MPFGRTRQILIVFLRDPEQALLRDGIVNEREKHSKRQPQHGLFIICFMPSLCALLLRKEFSVIDWDDWIQDSLISSVAGSKAWGSDCSPFLVSRHVTALSTGPHTCTGEQIPLPPHGHGDSYLGSNLLEAARCGRHCSSCCQGSCSLSAQGEKQQDQRIHCMC